MKRSFFLIAPYAAWMVLMSVLPQTAWAYAARGAATSALLLAAWLADRGALSLGERKWRPVASPAAGIAVGLAVFAVWIAPEAWLGFGTPLAAADSPYSPQVCGWTLTAVKLAASAFVIPIAEELFFRKWLVGFAGFWWMVALFAVEHGERWHVGALAGIAYGLLAERLGLWSAIVAHMATNLVLGLYVVLCGRWQFW